MSVKGLIAAPFTPMLENGDLNLDLIDQYVDILLEQKVRNVFVNGTTGEGMSLSMEERKQAASKWIKAGKGKLDYVIIHVGTGNLRDTQELSRHAEAEGANAIATLPPIYFKPRSVDVLVEYLKNVALAAPKTPLFYYHIPEMTGVTFKMHPVLGKAIAEIPNFAGVKFTSFDLSDFSVCVQDYKDKIALCYGKDEQIAYAYMLGAHAGVGSTYNYAGTLNFGIYEAAVNGDFKKANEEGKKAQKFIEILLNLGFGVAVNKALMIQATGLNLGPPRLPLKKPSKEKMDRIVSELHKVGFYKWIEEED